MLKAILALSFNRSSQSASSDVLFAFGMVLMLLKQSENSPIQNCLTELGAWGMNATDGQQKDARANAQTRVT